MKAEHTKKLFTVGGRGEWERGIENEEHGGC
jgi:hypothetical protein